MRSGYFKVLGIVILALLAGCSAMEVKKETIEKANAAKKGPESTPYRSITNFSTALRCMDTLFLDYGVRDVSVIVEDIVDQTKKVNAGTKDMLISAVSDMTKRSRAVRLIAYGQDSGNLIGFLNQAGRKNVYEVLPQYDIKGSITQYDENLVRKQADAGIGLDTYLNLGAARSAGASVLGLDLTVLSADDLSVLPGVTSRNSVLLFKEGNGLDGDATIKKFGINYSVSLSKTDGQSQALRTLIELASVELLGKLAKVPYWTCLGSDAKSEGVREEIGDWYAAMYSNPSELVGYFQAQMRARRFYDGPIDGEVNPQLKDAISRYRASIGLSAEPKLNLELFTAYLGTDHRKQTAAAPSTSTAPKTGPAPQAGAEAKPNKAPAIAEAKSSEAPAPQAKASEAPAQRTAESKPAPAALKLAIVSPNGAAKFKGGDSVKLTIAPNQDAHVYCYIQDETRKIMRFFPNRFQKDTLVPAAAPLQIPGTQRFQLVVNDKGAKETVVCFAAPRDLATELPAAVMGVDFEALPVTSVQQLREAFSKAAGNQLGEGYFYVETN